MAASYLTGVRLGLGSCAAAGGTDPVRLAPAANAVVAMTFRVGEECPRNTLIAARVTFDTGATGIVHADSSELTNLDGLRFAQC